jgi:hypothetical protein
VIVVDGVNDVAVARCDAGRRIRGIRLRFGHARRPPLRVRQQPTRGPCFSQAGRAPGTGGAAGEGAGVKASTGGAVGRATGSGTSRSPERAELVALPQALFVDGLSGCQSRWSRLVLEPVAPVTRHARPAFAHTAVAANPDLRNVLGRHRSVGRVRKPSADPATLSGRSRPWHATRRRARSSRQARGPGGTLATRSVTCLSSTGCPFTR